MNHRRIARATGALYLGVGVAGVSSFLVLRPRLLGDDLTQASARFVEHQGLAATMVGLELTLMVLQVLAGFGFFLLFRSVDAIVAAALAIFAILNAVAILLSAACLSGALTLARAVEGSDVTSVRTLVVLSESAWAVGNVFFGLWLVPMGVLVLRSRWFPTTLGVVLLVGGAGYVGSAYLAQLAPDAAVVVGALVVPATLGELWMIGHLLVRGTSGRRPVVSSA